MKAIVIFLILRVLVTACGDENQQPLVTFEVKEDENENTGEKTKNSDIADEKRETNLPSSDSDIDTQQPTSKKSIQTATDGLDYRTSTASTEISSAVGIESASIAEEIAEETKALKLTDPTCKDPDPAKVLSGESYMKCDGTMATGSMVIATYLECTEDGQMGCLANATYKANSQTYSECSSNSQDGCITNSTYTSANLTNLTSSNIKLGVTIADVQGSYSGISYDQCTSNSQEGCITTNIFKAADLTNLVSSNIKSGIEIAGVQGNYSEPTYDQCTSNSQEGCITTNIFRAANLTNLVSSNIKSGIEIAGVQGNYSEPTYDQCTSNSQEGCITTNTFKAADLTNLVSSNIKSGIEIAGVQGNYSEPTYDQCTSNAQEGCITTNIFKAANLSNLLPDNVRSGIVLAGVTGSYTATSYDNCSGNLQTNCVTNSQYKAADFTNILPANIKEGVTAAGVLGTYDPLDGVVIESHSNCTDNGQTGCITTDTYKSANLANLSVANIKSGVNIAGTVGQYPSSNYPLSGTVGITNLDNATFNIRIKSNEAFEWFDRAGNHYTGSGSSNITAENILSGISIFGTAGTVEQGTAPNTWDIRKGVTVNGVTGSAKMTCRDDTSDPALVCDTASWATHAPVDGHTVYTDRITGLKWLFAASSPINAASNVQVCADLASQDPGWRLPSVPEIKNLELHKAFSLTPFGNYTMGSNMRVWSSTYYQTTRMTVGISPGVADAYVAATDTATIAFCVK